MALRYNIQLGLPDIRPKSELLEAQNAPEPVRVSFSSMEDDLSLARQLTTHPHTELFAAVGFGKSTKIPTILARQTGETVIHVVSNPLLAVHLYDYVYTSARRDGLSVPVELYSDTDYLSMKFPGSRVVFISAAQLVAWLLENPTDNNLSGATLYMDEAHESDTYYFLLEKLGLDLGAKRIIRVSTKWSAPSQQSSKIQSNVQRTTFDPQDTPDTWNVQDTTKHWYFAKDHNTVIYIDSSITAESLKRKYEAVGCTVYRLTSNMKSDVFREAIASTKDESKLVVLLAESSFRSGFTFEATTILDTGYTLYMSGAPGQMKKLKRDIYLTESEQAASRIGRLPRLDGIYVRPRTTLSEASSTLGGVELEAAAYVCRLLGFLPFSGLSNTILSRYDVPPEVTTVQALNSVYPLTYFVQDNQYRASYTVKKREVQTTRRVRSILETTDTVERLSEQVQEYDLGLSCVLADGNYYMFDNVSATLADRRSDIFPRGIDSIIELIACSKSTIVAYSQLDFRDQKTFLAILSQSYNTLCVDTRAMRAVLQTADNLLANSRNNCEDIIAKVKLEESKRTRLFRHIQQLSSIGLRVSPLPDLPRVYGARVKYFTEQLKLLVPRITPEPEIAAVTVKVREEPYLFRVFEELQRTVYGGSWYIQETKIGPTGLLLDTVVFMPKPCAKYPEGTKLIRLVGRNNHEPEEPEQPIGYNMLHCLLQDDSNFDQSFARTGVANGVVDFTEYGLIRYYPKSDIWMGIAPPNSSIRQPSDLPHGHHIRRQANLLYPWLVPNR